MDSVLQALAPVVVTLGLGIFAGWRGLFDARDATAINRMVLRFCLPLALFAGILRVHRESVLSSGPLALLILLGMVGGYGLTLLVARFLARRSLADSVLQALAIGNPSVPFIGTVVLGAIIGPKSVLPISLSSLTINILLVPLSFVLLAMDPATQPEAGAAKAGTLGGHLRHAMAEPVVWAPLLALLLVLCGIQVPHAALGSFTLLGEATGGVALFAAGIILFLNKPAMTQAVVASVTLRNLIAPLAIWGVALAFGVTHTVLREAVITMSMPTASMVVILSSRIGRGQREAASVLFFSTIASILTMGAFILATG